MNSNLRDKRRQAFPKGNFGMLRIPDKKRCVENKNNVLKELVITWENAFAVMFEKVTNVHMPHINSVITQY